MAVHLGEGARACVAAALLAAAVGAYGPQSDPKDATHKGWMGTMRDVKKWDPPPHELEAWRAQHGRVKAEEERRARLRAANEERARVAPPGVRRRLGVCITGQAERLELRSKLQRLVLPNRDAFDIDLVFVLGPVGTARYVNHLSNVGGRQSWTEQSLQRAIAMLEFEGRVRIQLRPQEPVPMLHYSYVNDSEKWSNDLGKRILRSRSHVRQWWSLWECHGHFVQLEAAAGRPYDVLLKLRDDTLLLQDLPLAAANRTRYGGHVVTKNCNNWKGLNDKAAVLDGAHGYSYFALPLLDWFMEYQKLRRFAKGGRLPNPEQYLAALMRMHNVPVNESPPDLFPFLTGRLMAGPDGAPKTCVQIHPLKLGKGATCTPTSCRTRVAIYCNQCPGGGLGNDKASKQVLLGRLMHRCKEISQPGFACGPSHSLFL